MNILFIYPVPSPKKNIITNYLKYQQGIGSLSAVLKQNGHTTSLLCLHELDTAKINSKITSFNPGIIAISSTTNQINLSKQISEYIYNKYKLPIVIGGPHATVAPEDTINSPGVFGVCIGEGEYALLELVDKLEKGEPHLNVKNFWFKHEGKIHKNPIRPLIDNLDELPFPDRELFDFQKIINESNCVDMFVVRGCPHGCTNCINNALIKLFKDKGKYVRFRSVDNVIEELKVIIKNYQRVNYIQFQDETFTMNKVWLKEFCEKYKKEINLPFQADTRADRVDGESLSWLKSAGCDMLDIGVESGNDYIRNYVLKRNMPIEKLKHSCKLIKKAGIRLWTFNMIGLPYETAENIEETIKLNKQLKPNVVFVSVFQPYPGTELYDLCKKNGWLTNMHLEGYFTNKTLLNQPSISKKEIAYYHNIFPWAILYPTLAPFVKVLAKTPAYNDRSLYDVLFPAVKLAYKFKLLVVDRYLKGITYRIKRAF